MSDASEQGSSFIRDLGDAARQNPVSAALIGMGVLWLFAGGRAGERAEKLARRTRFDRFPDAVGNPFDAAGSTLKSSVKSAGRTVSSATERMENGASAVLDDATRFGREQADTLSEYARTIPRSGAEMMGNVRSNLTDLFQAQPLALGAVGLAIGAGIAAALPPTELEADYLGETSDAMKEKARDFAAEQTARATTVAESVVSAAAEEARNQGLTAEGAKSAAGEVSAKVGRVVDAAAGKGISERTG
jgi:hypothetical protein